MKQGWSKACDSSPNQCAFQPCTHRGASSAVAIVAYRVLLLLLKVTCHLNDSGYMGLQIQGGFNEPL
ncbi:hypothetical protein GQ54DRAFT_299982, partial [Martensiomyces pterosporus]